VNENDVVAVDEIKFGDNDILASLVTILVGGDLLILLSTTNGLREPTASGRTKRVTFSETVTKEILALADGKGSDFSSGGMESKLRSAEKAAKVGAMVVIADGRRPHVIPQVIAGKDIGTLIGSSTQSQRRVLRGRKLWLAFFHKVYGSVIVDEGAKNALTSKGYSLLPIGIREVQGKFSKGSLVNVKSMSGTVIAQGLTGYSSEEIRKIMGRQSSEIRQILGMKDCDEVIHRDNLIVKVNQQGDQYGIA